MGQLLSNPSSVPVSVAADWETLLNVNSAGNVGFNAISLQNWDAGTLAPAIAAGSMIEINGSIAYFQNEEAIGGIQTGLNYLQFVVSGTTVTPSWTLTAPAWNAAKVGWYAGSNRASGHRVTLESSAYYYKNKIKDGFGGLTNIPDYTDPAGRYFAKTFGGPGGETWTPTGGYIFSSANNILLKIWSGSQWLPTSQSGELEFSAGFNVMDGKSVALYGLSGQVLHYRKLW